MSYTVGIKRRFLPGYRKVQVTGHDWKDFRFILNLIDGSQESIPGFQLSSLKVYADFWTHLAQLERSSPGIVPRETPPPVTEAASEETAPSKLWWDEDTSHMPEEVRRATERVRRLSEGNVPN